MENRNQNQNNQWKKLVMEEEEEGYYTQLVHLLHGVLGKDVE